MWFGSGGTSTTFASMVFHCAPKAVIPSAVIRSTVCAGTSCGGMIGAGAGGSGGTAGAGCDCTIRIEPNSNGAATNAAQAISRPRYVIRMLFPPCFFEHQSAETFVIAMAKPGYL